MGDIRKICDRGGATLSVAVVDGRLYPDFDRNSIRSVQTFKARPDDVVVCAYPKSGTHWVWEIVRMLQANTTEVPPLEKDVAMIEDAPVQNITDMTSPRTLNTHAHFEVLSSDFAKKKVKVVYITRDPRDVAVSFYNHTRKLVQYYNYQGKWEDYFCLYIDGDVDYESWWTHTKGWESGIADHSDLNVHVTSYESLHKDTFGEVKKLSGFLGVQTDDSLIEKIIQKSSFDNMRATKGAVEEFDGNKGGSPVMYRKGKVGDWKNWFTVAQSETFNQRFEHEMVGTKAYELYSHTKWRDTNMNEKS